MKKLVVVFALLIAGMSFNVASAQDKNKLSLGLQGAFNFNKTGVGARFGYDFTDILRFTVDGTYYSTANETLDVYQGTKLTNTLNKGRLWDANVNLNFVFGEKNFHFYLISGLGFTYGYKFGLVFDREIYDNYGNVVAYGITEDDVWECQRIGVSLNGGFGIEWQITPAFRWNLEQTLNIGLPSLSTWMCKTGVAYCF